jgi:hypothetical protein
MRRPTAITERDADREEQGEFLLEENEDGTHTCRIATSTAIRGKMDRAIIITGHPGIGKTWFLSYVLVERLLRFLPTIVQYGPTDPEHVIGASHILFDEHGTRFIHALKDEDDLLKIQISGSFATGSPLVWPRVLKSIVGRCRSSSRVSRIFTIDLERKRGNIKIYTDH